jgi:hypothetical protein
MACGTGERSEAHRVSDHPTYIAITWTRHRGAIAPPSLASPAPPEAPWAKTGPNLAGGGGCLV